MAIRVYKVAVVGCPRAIICPEGVLDGVGKSTLCNRFVRSEAYSEDHQEDSSQVTESEWTRNPVFNGDQFVYWGAANKHLPDKTRVRFQVVEHTEFYKAPAAATTGSGSDEEDETHWRRQRRRSRRDRDKVADTSDLHGGRLSPHSAQDDYIARASAVHFRSQKPGKMAYRLKATETAVKRASGPIRATTQLFPNEEFSAKKNMGVYGFICVFDPTLEGDYMQRQLNFLSQLLPALVKTKRKVVIACVKCDVVEEHAIRFGSKLSSYALKKTIPFFEVSARDSVNINDVFFSLISTPKKSKNGHHNGTGYPGYREIMDSRKGDVNRAKDAFRQSLQLSVTDFASTWNEMLPVLRIDRSYQSIQQIAGAEADETLLKLFQLRLIEIKLLEASKQYGNSLAKKADKDQSKQYQVYLKEAFAGHPDLRADAYKDYLPNLSISDDSTILTEPSTPSSCCPTPEVADIHARVSRLRSATLSDLPELDGPVPVPAHLNRSLDDIAERDKFELTPPPLPSRSNGASSNSPRHKRGASETPSNYSGERRLSCSTDCLYVPPQQGDGENNLAKNPHGISYDRLDAEPYLQPREVKIVLNHTPPEQKAEPPVKDKRNTAGFLSMRMPKKLRTKESAAEKKSNSLERKTHKRSHSNPFLLESVASGDQLSPPRLPPRNQVESSGTSLATPSHASSRRSSTLASPLESSLEFIASPGPITEGAWRPLSDMPLPPLPDESESPRVVRVRLPTSKSVDSKDLDNISQTSGPFEEIDTSESRKSPVPVSTSSTLKREKSVGTSSESDKEKDDQYAEIADFQQYMQMAPAPVDKSKALRTSGAQGEESQTASGGGKKENVSGSAPLMTTLKKKLKKSGAKDASNKAGGNQSPPPPLHHHHSVSTSALRSATMPKLLPKQMTSSHLHDPRPLPPSPTKVTRKISSGSGNNIYEVIDEDFIRGVWRNRPSRQNSRRELLTDYLPQMDRSMWPKYLETVHKFFSLPQVQEQWTQMVGSVMKDVDPEDILPPYYKVYISQAHPSLVAHSTEEDLKEEEEEEAPEADKGEKDVGTALLEKLAAAAKSAQKPAPPVSQPSATDTPTHDSHPSSSKLQTPPPSSATNQHKSSPVAGRKSPVAVRQVVQQQQPIRTGSPVTSTPIRTPISSTRGHTPLTQSTGSNELILMLNQCQEYDSSSEEEEEDSDDMSEDFNSDSSDSDLDMEIDIDLHASNQHIFDELLKGSDLFNASATSNSLASSLADTTANTTTTTAATASASPAAHTSPHASPPARTSPPPHTSPPPCTSLPARTSPPVHTSPPAAHTSPPPRTACISPDNAGKRPKPPVKPKPRHVPIPVTDLDAALELRASVSNDSDLVSTDSALTKSPPHSNHSAREFDLEKMAAREASAEGTVEVEPNVRPSQFLKNKARYRLKSRGDGSEDGRDSGTSTPN